MTLIGRLMVASPTMLDPNFAGGVVLICAHDSDGALGVLLNRPTDLAVGEHLPRWAVQAAPPAVVFLGGPVQVGVAIGIGTSSGPAELTPVMGEIGMIDLASAGPDTIGTVRIFAGYAGWGGGQLEDEVDRGDWLVVPAQPDDAFAPDPGELRRRVLRRQPDRSRFYADYPDDPRLN